MPPQLNKIGVVGLATFVPPSAAARRQPAPQEMGRPLPTPWLTVSNVAFRKHPVSVKVTAIVAAH
jgi:hypothetical protein